MVCNTANFNMDSSMTVRYLPCRVLPGLLDSEFYVMLPDASAYVPRSAVRVPTEPSESEVEGQLEVLVIERDPHLDRTLIEMPGEAVVGHARSWVPSNSLINAAIA
jgi:hypothetical protein